MCCTLLEWFALRQLKEFADHFTRMHQGNSTSSSSLLNQLASASQWLNQRLYRWPRYDSQVSLPLPSFSFLSNQTQSDWVTCICEFLPMKFRKLSCYLGLYLGRKILDGGLHLLVRARRDLRHCRLHIRYLFSYQSLHRRSLCDKRPVLHRNSSGSNYSRALHFRCVHKTFHLKSWHLWLLMGTLLDKGHLCHIQTDQLKIFWIPWHFKSMFLSCH